MIVFHNLVQDGSGEGFNDSEDDFSADGCRRWLVYSYSITWAWLVKHYHYCQRFNVFIIKLSYMYSVVIGQAK